MTIEEEAIQKGVPMPETCKGLDWKEETLFYWYKQESEWKIASIGNNPKSYYGQNFYYDVKVAFAVNGNLQERFIPAPQMHELIIAIGNKDGGVDLREGFFMTDNHGSKVENNHFAQALAELYLVVRNLDVE